MKKIVLTLAAVALLATACSDGLDTPAGGGTAITNSSYMGIKSSVIAFEKTTDGGETVIEPRLAALATEDTKITVSVEDFLKEYNEENSTKFQILPTEAFELYEIGDPTNKSTNGKLTVTVKKGQISSKVGVKVNPLDTETYPMSIRYAIPIRITSAATQVLPDRDAVISFNRPYKTSVVTIKRGNCIQVKLDQELIDQKATEYTIQGHYMFPGYASQNQTTMNMVYYSRVNASGIQIKDGAADGDATWTHSEMPVDKWHQITYVYKGNDFKVYVNGVLIKTFLRANLYVASPISIGNAASAYSYDFRFREFRLWNRALTESEIKEGLYLPVDPNAEGLIAYVPIDEKDKGQPFTDRTKYKNEVIYRANPGADITFEKFEHTWTDNVKFPAEGLVIEE